MNGIICIYKEKGMTSFDVVAAVRRIYNTKRVGHGGTLDPMAEGVLPVFVGNATKAADFCPDDTKQYLAGFQFGITTDTQDITGKVLSTCDDYVSRNKMPMVERMFSGEQLQTPPMYSAVKVNGQRLYDLARKGEVVSRQPRKITVYEIKVTNYGYNCGEMSVTCSKGTYIRTLIHDIGQKLGTGAVMTSLVRTRSGVFKLKDCHRLAELEGKTEQELESLLMPLEKLYGQLPKAHLDEKQTELFRNGAELDADRIRFDTIYDKGYYIEGADGVFLGLGKIGEKHQLEVMRRFNTEAAAKIAQAAKEQSYNPPPPVSEAEIARDVPFVPKPKKPKTDQSVADEKQETEEVKESEAAEPEQTAEQDVNKSTEEVKPQDISIEEAETAQEESPLPDQQETSQIEEAPTEESEA
ncbi:MAG: tRNA pseudouridine(55) synthase TruB, partial [Ruminococcaceae bacterium]|nr:tRNA pseudouridine(55) synthase TruB [Oscillospiraceae bacterium]